MHRTPEDQEVEAGRDVRIPCQVVSREGDDDIEIVWTKDDVRIVPSRSKLQLFETWILWYQTSSY